MNNLISSTTLEGRYAKSRMKRSSKGGRYQIVLGPKSAARLDDLKTRVDPESYTEVFRVSLRILEAILDETDRGSEFLIKDKDGQIYPFRFFVD